MSTRLTCIDEVLTLLRDMLLGRSWWELATDGVKQWRGPGLSIKWKKPALDASYREATLVEEVMIPVKRGVKCSETQEAKLL